VSSWPRSYCSKIYIYICNLCLTVTATYESSISACDEMYSIQLLCDKVCQWLAADRLFSPGTLVSSMNKCDLLDTTEILMKIVLNFHNWLCGYIQTHLPYDWAQGYPIMMWRRKKHTHSWWVVFIKKNIRFGKYFQRCSVLIKSYIRFVCTVKLIFLHQTHYFA
jgi:hypothetical protein